MGKKAHSKLIYCFIMPISTFLRSRRYHKINHTAEITVHTAPVAFDMSALSVKPSGEIMM